MLKGLEQETGIEPATNGFVVERGKRERNAQLTETRRANPICQVTKVQYPRLSSRNPVSLISPRIVVNYAYERNRF